MRQKVSRMARHGDASFWNFLKWEREQASSAYAVAFQQSVGLQPLLADAGSPPRPYPEIDKARYQAPGFRHFMGSLGPLSDERYTLNRIAFNPLSEKMCVAAEALMRKLAHIIVQEPEPKEKNLRLPSGYTYFLQLVAHDLVHSSIVVSRNKEQLSSLANVRRLPLRLETIYGGGPTACPHAYQFNNMRFRNRLRLGQIRENGKYGSPKGEYLDVARGRATEVGESEKYPEALIGDARNDSHAILSQMLVLGHRIHNAIIKTIEGAGIKSTGDQFTDTQRAFVAAQATLILIYRHYIRNDLLCRVLHPAVYRAYEAGRVPLLNVGVGAEQDQWLVPLEFAYGFFRFAHAMIRSSYTFNDYRAGYPFGLQDILQQNSESAAGNMPFERQWTIEWKHFFTADTGDTNNLSNLIGPWASQPFGKEPSGDLVYRDLISSIAVMPWSIGALIEKIRPTHGELLNLSDLLRCKSEEKRRPFEASLAEWLGQRAHHDGSGLSDSDIDSLAFDPPIPFYVRYEAAHDAGGKHLGILGSIVIADVFYGIFRNDKVLGIESTGPLTDQLSDLSRILFDDANVLASWGEIATLTAIVMEVDKACPPTGNA
jgi:Animal haem peroxidase